MSRRDCPDCGGKGEVPTLDEASGLYFQTMCCGRGCGWRSNSIGRVLLRVGDLVRLQDGPAVVVRTNESGAYCTALQKRHVEVNTRFGDKAAFDAPGRHVIVSAHTEPFALVERRGEAWVDKFLAKKKTNGSALPGQPVPTPKEEPTEGNGNMSRQAAARGGLAAEKREMDSIAPKRRGRPRKADAEANGHTPEPKAEKPEEKEHKPKGLPDDEVKDFIKKFREKEPDAAPSKIVKALRESGKSCSIERLTKLAA